MNSRASVLIAAAVLVLGLLASAAAGESGRKVLVIGLTPEMNVFKQKERYKPLADYLAVETGTEVKLTVLSRYGNITDSFRNREMDAAFFGSFIGAVALEQLKVLPVARPVEADGESTYSGFIFTRKNSRIRDVPDMRGKKFCYVDKATTAGYLYPLAFLKSRGVADVNGYFSETFYSGSHDASIMMVLNGKADIGAAKSTVYELLRKKDPRIDSQLTIIARSPRFPSNGFCVRNDLDERLKKKLRQALLNIEKSPGGRKALEQLGAQRFIETRREDYEPVVRIAAQAGVDLKQYRYVNR
jgi:phosphonate transport system substrate-binding protein